MGPGNRTGQWCIMERFRLLSSTQTVSSTVNSPSPDLRHGPAIQRGDEHPVLELEFAHGPEHVPALYHIAGLYRRDKRPFPGPVKPRCGDAAADEVAAQGKEDREGPLDAVVDGGKEPGADSTESGVSVFVTDSPRVRPVVSS